MAESCNEVLKKYAAPLARKERLQVCAAWAFEKV
jgi:hypothetical protein